MKSLASFFNSQMNETVTIDRIVAAGSAHNKPSIAGAVTEVDTDYVIVTKDGNQILIPYHAILLVTPKRGDFVKPKIVAV